MGVAEQIEPPLVEDEGVRVDPVEFGFAAGGRFVLQADLLLEEQRPAQPFQQVGRAGIVAPPLQQRQGNPRNPLQMGGIAGGSTELILRKMAARSSWKGVPCRMSSCERRK